MLLLFLHTLNSIKMQNLLLLHGALGHKGQFENLRPLLEKDFKLFTLNFSGHSDKPLPDNLSIDSMARETADFIDREIKGEVSIFGHSMGGYVGLYIARHGLANVTKVMTLGTKLLWNPDTAANESRMLNVAKMKEKVPAFATQLERIHGAKWEGLCENIAAMLVDMGNKPPLDKEDMAEIKIPAQLSLGDRDRMVTIEETVEAFRHLPNGRLLIMPGVSHPYEQVDVKRLAYKINGFIGDGQ